jgi:hypothetical protein
VLLVGRRVLKPIVRTPTLSSCTRPASAGKARQGRCAVGAVAAAPARSSASRIRSGVQYWSAVAAVASRPIAAEPTAGTPRSRSAMVNPMGNGALVMTPELAGASGAGAPRAGLGSGIVAWFAVGCPVCNKIVVSLLGASGATSIFAPVQPALGAAAVVLAAGALAARIRAIRQGTCRVPSQPPRPSRARGWRTARGRSRAAAAPRSGR